MQNETNRLLDWLVDHSEFLGVTVENWLLVVFGGLLIYLAGLVIARRCAVRAH